MNNKTLTLNQIINLIQKEAELNKIPHERLALLNTVVNYIQEKVTANKIVNLNFICTHNSRRSQLSQVWAQIMGNFFHINCNCFSGGVEVTAFNYRAVNTLINQGFNIQFEATNNPIYNITTKDSKLAVKAFSKLFDDPINPKENFAAIMTCSDADENCPFIPGTETRIPLRYIDPKAFDDTNLETEKYLERSNQIAIEMHYIFSNIKKTN